MKLNYVIFKFFIWKSLSPDVTFGINFDNNSFSALKYNTDIFVNFSLWKRILFIV
jgi:hypothetical protein